MSPLSRTLSSFALAAAVFGATLAPSAAAQETDEAADGIVAGDVVAQLSAIKKPKKPIDKTPIDDKDDEEEGEDEEDDVVGDAPKSDKPSRTVPGVTPKPGPKKPELRDGVTAPKKPIDEGTGVKRPIVKQPRQPRDIGKTPRVGDDPPTTRRPRTPTSPDEPRRTVRRPRTNPQPAPDQPPPSNGGGGGGGGDGGGCCCCSPKVTGMAVGGGILGGVSGLVVGGVIGGGAGYLFAPTSTAGQAPSESDKQFALGVGAAIGAVSGLVLGGVAGVGAGAALGGMLSE